MNEADVPTPQSSWPGGYLTRSVLHAMQFWPKNHIPSQALTREEYYNQETAPTRPPPKAHRTQGMDTSHQGDLDYE